MPSIFVVGIIIFFGFVFGEMTARLKLPRVSGYILAGIVLNLDAFNFMFNGDSLTQADLMTNIALSFITFSVGGTLLYGNIKKMGKNILSIAFFESFFAFVAIFLGFLLLMPSFPPVAGAGWVSVFIPLSLLLGSLGSPTDPSATLAVKHEYNAQGEVSDTIMGVAALDDVAGIINYSVAMAVAGILVGSGGGFDSSFLLEPVVKIGGAVLLGAAFGVLFNLITVAVKRETEGVFIVLIMGLLLICFGTASQLGVDELLSTLVMGVVVTNFNMKSKTIFRMLERYLEELVFVLFFVISSMQLDFSVLTSSLVLVIGFVIFRAIGKLCGAALGARVSGCTVSVRRYTAGGLIPQGGIVIGLALMIGHNPGLENIAHVIINIVIGATIIHELVGPIAAKFALKKAGEIS